MPHAPRPSLRSGSSSRSSITASDAIPVSTVTLENNTVKLTIPAISGSYEGTLNPTATELKGHWTQGVPLPLNLARATLAIHGAREGHRPGDPVVEVVPADDQLMVEALVQPKDIGFVHIGQPAKVKLTAYDYAIYGAMEGKVATISADAVPMGDKGQAFYQVRIETSTTAMESLGKKLPIIPGMQAQVDIVTGHKTVLRYITKPLTAVKENAFRER